MAGTRILATLIYNCVKLVGIEKPLELLEVVRWHGKVSGSSGRIGDHFLASREQLSQPPFLHPESQLLAFTSGSGGTLLSHDKVQALSYAQHTRQLISCGGDGGIVVWNMDVERQESGPCMDGGPKEDNSVVSRDETKWFIGSSLSNLV
ncbi:hypothetical protein P7K49_000440 [Saguinus oedipus]|uniref:Uncharacterized protein n=1 Tax=Saguinus oedipus TaxID=9490 RepID=A0ABQ9WBN6_SAGOE|nr:hypothetical protein P7K49_000440 [Saguinus oedipus]